MTGNKDKVTFAVSFTGEYLKRGKEIKKYLNKLKRTRGIGQISPVSTFLRKAIDRHYVFVTSGSVESKPEIISESEASESQEENHVTKEYSFINTRYKGLKCSLCGKDTFGEKVLGQIHKDSSKSYVCQDCEIDAIGDPTLLKKHRKTREYDRLIRMQKKEIEENDETIDELLYVKAFDAIHKAFCEAHKREMQSSQPDDEVIQLLRKYLPIIKDVERIALKRVEERTNRAIESKSYEIEQASKIIKSKGKEEWNEKARKFHARPYDDSRIKNILCPEKSAKPGAGKVFVTRQECENHKEENYQAWLACKNFKAGESALEG